MIKAKDNSGTRELDRALIKAATQRTIVRKEFDKMRVYGPLPKDLEELEKEMVKEDHEFIDYLCDFFSIEKINWEE